MDAVIISQLLLTTFLLQLTAENADLNTHTTFKPANSVHYDEFCLRISDKSHWTSSKPVTQIPTKSTNKEPRLSEQTTQPNRESIQLLHQPTTDATRPHSQSDQTPMQQTPTYLEQTQPLDQPTTDAARPYSQSAQTPMRQTPTYLESTQQPELRILQTIKEEVISDIVMPPVGELFAACHCKETEKNLETEVSNFKSMLILNPTGICTSRQFIVTMMGGVEVCVTKLTARAYIDYECRRAEQTEARSKEETLATSLTEWDTTTPLPTDVDFDVADFEDGPMACVSCQVQTNLADVDPKSIKLLYVMRQTDPCPVYISVSPKVGQEFCLDFDKPASKRFLRKLEIPPSQKKVVDGCRCKEKEKKPPHKTSHETRIWLPSETCGSTEFIETLKNDRKVCVIASSLLPYFEFVSLSKSEPVGDIEPSSSSGQKDELPSTEKNVETANCHNCQSSKNWEDFDLKDVESMTMMGQADSCPVLLQVITREHFCMDLSHTGLQTLLEKLQL
uniref:uncharacterized protein n=1 Tax=Semicossyphus pulcher TaxID=241346 RepID=UPI0037E75D03